MKPLYVITTVFNPHRYRSRYRLYRNFAGWVQRCEVPLITVEIVLGERPWEITEAGNPHHLQLRTRHELWHKERALNLGVQHLTQRVDPGWEYVAWMDADIKLMRDDWAAETVHLLQHYAVVQMFGVASWLGPNEEPLFQANSIIRNYVEHGEVDWYDHPGMTFRSKAKKRERERQGLYAVRTGHPGWAWAFRRNELDQVGGWLDICANGSADLHMAGCYTGKSDLAVAADVSPGYRKAIVTYGERCEYNIRRNVGYMPGLGVHHWHGRSQLRGYQERGGLLCDYQYDPTTDLLPDPNAGGLWKWSLHDPRVMALAIATRRSLMARNEDGNEV